MYQRLLSKSRYKLALDCPNKLYYTKKKEYANKKLEDPFLEALAQGGFQVEELARLEYPDGILIENNDWDYDLLVEQTNKLLQRKLW
jgi:SET domain-containing protein